jgi:hypothetical protein
MSYENYKMKIECLGPVAVKLGQSEVHAPGHDAWGTVTCDVCGEQFSIGPNRIYASRRTAQDCVRQLETVLAREHEDRKPHMNSYELGD